MSEWWARTKARRTGTGGYDRGRGGKYALEHERNVSCVVSFFFSVLYAWRGMAGRRRPGREARCRAPMMAGVRRATHLRHERGETLALRRHGGVARCLPTTKKSLTCIKKVNTRRTPPRSRLDAVNHSHHVDRGTAPDGPRDGPPRWSRRGCRRDPRANTRAGSFLLNN